MGSRGIRKTGDTIQKMEWPKELLTSEREKLLQTIRHKEGELNLLRDNVYELQGQLQQSYIRTKELREKLVGKTD